MERFDQRQGAMIVALLRPHRTIRGATSSLSLWRARCLFVSFISLCSLSLVPSLVFGSRVEQLFHQFFIWRLTEVLTSQGWSGCLGCGRPPKGSRAPGTSCSFFRSSGSPLLGAFSFVWMSLLHGWASFRFFHLDSVPSLLRVRQELVRPFSCAVSPGSPSLFFVFSHLDRICESGLFSSNLPAADLWCFDRYVGEVIGPVFFGPEPFGYVTVARLGAAFGIVVVTVSFPYGFLSLIVSVPFDVFLYSFHSRFWTFAIVSWCALQRFVRIATAKEDTVSCSS